MGNNPACSYVNKYKLQEFSLYPLLVFDKYFLPLHEQISDMLP